MSLTRAQFACHRSRYRPTSASVQATTLRFNWLRRLNMALLCTMYVICYMCPRPCSWICADMSQCVDIEFAEPEDVAEVTRDNCFNSSHIAFSQIFAAT